MLRLPPRPKAKPQSHVHLCETSLTVIDKVAWHANSVRDTSPQLAVIAPVFISDALITFELACDNDRLSNSLLPYGVPNSGIISASASASASAPAAARRTTKLLIQQTVSFQLHCAVS